MKFSQRFVHRPSVFTLKPLAATLLALSLPVQAATHVVNNEADLIAAINAVNSTAGANFIEFKQDITLTGPLPPITGTVTIKGQGKYLSGDTDGDGNPDVQLLVVGSNSAPGTSVLVQISGLTLKDGLAAGGAGADGTGGALQINGNADVILKDVRIIDSKAEGGNAVVANGDGGNGLGGGVYVAPGGRLSVSGSSDPAADPLNATPNITGSTVAGGTANGTGSDGIAAGGGIFLDGSGNLRLSANPDTVLAIHGDISDGAGTGVGTGSWNLILEGGGGASVDPTDPNADRNYGTIVMGGNNQYSGDTYISDVNVGISSMGALGAGGVVALDNGGLVVAPGVDIDRELVLASGGGRIGVYGGAGILSGDVTGTGNLMKVGEGDLDLQGNSNFDGDWRVRQGALVLDSNARLGTLPDLILDGGGLNFSADVNDLRSFDITNRGGYIDNQGHDVVLAGKINNWDGLVQGITLTFRDSTGTGTTTLADGFSNGTGHSHIESGTVIGNIGTGYLEIDGGAEYRLGGGDRTVRGLNGSGDVTLGNNDLTIALAYDPAGGIGPSFGGNISGAGGLELTNLVSSFSWTLQQTLGSLQVTTAEFLTQELAAGNTYSGGTTVGRGVLLNLIDPTSIGTGDLTLNNGAIGISSGTFNMDINLAGSVGILQTGGDVDFTGQLIGSADFLKQGSGTLTLHGNNTGTFSGDLVVAGSGSYVALADENAAGSGSLVLSDGGGLKLLQDTANLRPVKIAGGNGVIDTGVFNVTSSGAITGSGILPSRLVKEGTGSLILTNTLQLDGGVSIAAGTMRLVDGAGSSGGAITAPPPNPLCWLLPELCPAITIDIGSGAALVVERSNVAQVEIRDSLTGGGEIIKQGSSVLRLRGDNSFSGGLTVLEGYITGDTSESYGWGTITLDNGAGLQLASDLYRDVVLGANNGSLQVTGGNSYQFGGQLLGTGNLLKTGTGALVYTGVATTDIHVQAGVLQVGDGYVGTLLSNVEVDTGAELVFNRDDLTQYDGVVSGSGDVIKRGLGELVLTGDHLFAGDVKIENGILRLGNGGTTGSLTGGADIAAGAELVVNRSGVADISGSLKGAGTLRQVGTGQLRLPGDSSLFAGNTVVESGSLRIDGILGGDVDLFYGTRLQGIGSILGNLDLQDGSIFTPGNSMGTFTVGGNMTMNAGSQLHIEIDELGNHDDVQVGGTASLAGSLFVQPVAGTYGPGCCSYTILQAAGGVSGTFDSVNNSLAFLNTTVTYNANDVVLSVARNGSGFGTLANLTWNQQQVSNALDGIEAADPTNVLVGMITPLTDAQARDAYDSMSGDSLLAQANMAGTASRRFGQILSVRSSRLGLGSRSGRGESMESSLAAVRAGNMPELPAAFAQNMNPLQYDGPTSVVEGVWLEAAGFRLNESSDGVVGSAASSFNGNVLALGLDGYWSDSVIVGFGLGQLKGDLAFDNRQAEADVSGAYAGFYTRFESRNGWHYKAALSVGKQDADQTRTVTIGGTTVKAQSTAAISNMNLDLETGFALHLGNYSMRPYAMVDVQSLKREAISETGAGALSLQVDAATDMLGEFGVGIEFSRPWLTAGERWAQIQSGVALMLPFGDTQREQTLRFNGTNNSYTVQATPNDTPTLQLSLGGEWYFSPRVALWGGYEGRFSSSTKEHNGVLSIQYRW